MVSGMCFAVTSLPVRVTNLANRCVRISVQHLNSGFFEMTRSVRSL
jgi:hypothetical protein